MEAHATPSWVLIAYLIAGICFIMALRGLSSPLSAQRGNQFGIRHASREVFRVTAAHAPEPHDPDAQAVHGSTMRCSRQDVVAASASASALTPSSIDVRALARPATTSKKCAISAAYAAR